VLADYELCARKHCSYSARKDLTGMGSSVVLGFVIRRNRARRSIFGTRIQRQIGDATKQNVNSFKIVDIAMVLSGARQQVAPQR
jgi:hypothetical protein